MGAPAGERQAAAIDQRAEATDPAASGCTAIDREAIDAAIWEAVRQRVGDPRNLIEVLHAIQPLEGHLSHRSLHQVACELRLPLSRVYGVASFYHLFSRQPPAPHRLAICGGTACFVNGAARLRACLAERLGLAGEGGRSGDWELLSTGCQSACGSLPVLRLNEGAATPVHLEPEATLHGQLEALGIPAAAGRPQPRR